MSLPIEGLQQGDSPSSAVWSLSWRWGTGVAALAIGAMAVGYQVSTHVLRDESTTVVPAAPSSTTATGVPDLGTDGKPAVPVDGDPLATKAADGSVPTWPFWEFQLQDPLPAREQPLTPVSWRVLGAALFDGRWHAIVQRHGASEPSYYKTGDKLPGGYVIQEITQEDMTLRAGRREIVLAYIGSK